MACTHTRRSSNDPQAAARYASLGIEADGLGLLAAARFREDEHVALLGEVVTQHRQTPNVLGSLLPAGHAGTGELAYLGDVGTGFTEAARRYLLALLRPLQRPIQLSPPSPSALGGGRVVRPHPGPVIGWCWWWLGRSRTGRSLAIRASATRPGAGYAPTGTPQPSINLPVPQ